MRRRTRLDRQRRKRVVRALRAALAAVSRDDAWYVTVRPEHVRGFSVGARALLHEIAYELSACGIVMQVYGDVIGQGLTVLASPPDLTFAVALLEVRAGESS